MKSFRFMSKLIVTMLAFVFCWSCQEQDGLVVAYMNASTTRTKFVQEGDYMARSLKSLGHEVIVVAAEDDDALQLSQGYELLEKGVDALVIVAVNGNTIAPLVREAKRRGVSVFAYNRLINNAELDFLIAGDNAGYANLFCEAVLEKSPAGNYVVLGGDRFDMNGLALLQHILDNLKPHVESGRINLVYETFIEGWSRERAEFEMQKIVDAYGDAIDVVIACNDPMGMGAYEVLKKNGVHHGVLVTGQGAYQDVVQSIYNDGMFMTIHHPAEELGTGAAKLIDAVLRGGSVTDLADSYTFNGAMNVPTLSFPSVKVTKENLEEVLIQSGVYAREDLR